VAARPAGLHAQALRPPERPLAAAVHDAPRRSLDELDLSGTRVAFLGSLVRDGRLAYLIRTADARTGRVRKVADIGTGEGGQFIFDLGFHAGLLGWAKSCSGDPSGCSAGAFRYHPGSREIDHTGSVSQSIGFTLAGPSEAYVLQGTVDEDTEVPFDCPCRLERRTAVAWR
jgi:hypothetical protein